jgi:hypothetical protein
MYTIHTLLEFAEWLSGIEDGMTASAWRGVCEGLLVATLAT